MNEFSISARFDNAHQLTVIMDAETGNLSILWVDGDAGEVHEATYVWEDDGGEIPG